MSEVTIRVITLSGEQEVIIQLRNILLENLKQDSAILVSIIRRYFDIFGYAAKHTHEVMPCRDRAGIDEGGDRQGD